MTQNKYCPECDQINLNTAKFCSECGHDLSSDSKSLKLQICKECGQENNNRARFCSSCGEVLNRQKPVSWKKTKTRKANPKSQKRNQVQHSSFFSRYSFLFVIGGLILLFLFINNSDKKVPNSKNSPIQPVSQDFSLERKVMEVASKFTCSCGSCGEEALETCLCATAEQERNFIRQELRNGKSAVQTIAAVNKRYGHLKPEFTSKIEGSNLKLDLSGQKQNDLFSQITSSATGSNNRIAADKDRDEIFYHFECPCGQCGIPELRDCSCQHPKGATEVKLFIDGKIEHEKYTIGELVDIVEAEYGHKIR
jgi:cytochrome c-type biogenesis protein CcmH/NrfF